MRLNLSSDPTGCCRKLRITLQHSDAWLWPPLRAIEIVCAFSLMASGSCLLAFLGIVNRATFKFHGCPFCVYVLVHSCFSVAADAHAREVNWGLLPLYALGINHTTLYHSNKEGLKFVPAQFEWLAMVVS